MIRINPHFSYIAPNCTYDQSPVTPLQTKEDCSEQNLLKLEARIEELERRLRLTSQSPKVSPSTSSIHSPPPHPGAPIEPFVPIPTGYDASSHRYSSTDFPLMADDWPLELPPKPLMLHLIDLFFTCYPNARRIIHRPTFSLQLLEHPSSPRFPFIPLLHSICAAAAVHSPHVTVAPLPDLRKYPAEDIFQDKTRVDQGRALMFDEQHFLLCKYQCMTAAREGVDLLGVIQACVVNSWWAFSLTMARNDKTSFRRICCRLIIPTRTTLLCTLNAQLCCPGHMSLNYGGYLITLPPKRSETRRK
ncbi:hypothetical protein RSAG8_05980, partial [Rhizoctonia solani AG-8 WAC10335]